LTVKSAGKEFSDFRVLSPSIYIFVFGCLARKFLFKNCFCWSFLRICSSVFGDLPIIMFRLGIYSYRKFTPRCTFLWIY